MFYILNSINLYYAVLREILQSDIVLVAHLLNKGNIVVFIFRVEALVPRVIFPVYVTVPLLYPFLLAGYPYCMIQRRVNRL